MHIKDLFSLKGKTALVIGGAGKIGRAVSEALVEAGGTVYIGSRNEDKCRKHADTLKASGGDARAVKLDSSDEASVIACRDRIMADGGKLDAVVNCAVEWPMQGFFEGTVKDWDRSMQTNSRGIFLVSRIFGQVMSETGGGSLVHVSSIYGIVAPAPGLYKGTNIVTEPDYYFHKGGMINFSRYLASFLGPHKVRVNCIAPGGYFDNQPEAFVTRYNEKVPLGRMAYADDIKGITVFLASDASQYITGTVIPVDGGLTIV